MAVQFDKELLIKHHFWILLGTTVLLLLIALVVLPTSVGQTIEKEQGAFKGSKDELKGMHEFKNGNWVDAFKVQDKIVQEKKKDVWGESWEVQKDMMTWPPELEEKWGPKYTYFLEDIGIYDREVFPKEYATQLYDVWQVANPLTYEGKASKGIIQFMGGFDSCLKLDVRFTKKVPPTSEDIWLAQEDLWVKRELLRVVRDANDAAAMFKEVDLVDSKGGQPAAKDPNHKRFRSPYWEMELQLSRNDKGKDRITGSIKNITHRRLARGNVYHIFLAPNSKTADADKVEEEVLVDGEPLAPGQSAPIPVIDLPEGKTVGGLFGVEQELTWRTAPVKRIDQLILGYTSSRTVDDVLVKPRQLTQTTTSAPVDPTAAPLGVAATATSSATMTPNGLSILRYSDVSEQVRHMPVGLAVIMDEDQIPEFLAAFANSRLRIQTLQCHWRHTREKIQGPVDESAEDSGPMLNRKRDLQGPTKYVPHKPQRSEVRTGGGETRPKTPKINTAKPTPSGPQTEEDEDMVLVEVAVYGSASLYERYPPKGATTPDQPGAVPPGTPSAPGTPAPGTPAPGSPSPPR